MRCLKEAKGNLVQKKETMQEPLSIFKILHEQYLELYKERKKEGEEEEKEREKRQL